jgi:hypothetical protein
LQYYRNGETIIGHHYDKVTQTLWEVWSNGEACGDFAEVMLVRSPRGLWYPKTTYDRIMSRVPEPGRGMQVVQLNCNAGSYNLRDTTIEAGLERVYQEWICKLIIEE